MSAADIIMRKSHDVTLTQYSVGSFSNGEYVAGDPTDQTIRMAIQELNGREMLQLSEGQRNRHYVKGYTTTPVRVSTSGNGVNIKADMIQDSGIYYEVQSVEWWPGDGTGIGEYYKVLMAELNPVSQVEIPGP